MMVLVELGTSKHKGRAVLEYPKILNWWNGRTSLPDVDQRG